MRKINIEELNKQYDLKLKQTNFDDKMEAIFYLQNIFDSDVKKNRGLENLSVEDWIKNRTLAMMSELAELIDEVNFKWWKNKKELDYENIKEELIDILHFFVGMCLNVNMTADEMFDIYLKKIKENFDRQYGKSQKKGYEIDKKSNNEN